MSRMSKHKTPSFIAELPLVVDSRQEAVLLARLEAARQVYNACLGEALARRERLLHGRGDQAARAMKKGAARGEAVAEGNKTAGFEEYALDEDGAQVGDRWVGGHLDSLVGQK